MARERRRAGRRCAAYAAAGAAAAFAAWHFAGRPAARGGDAAHASPAVRPTTSASATQPRIAPSAPPTAARLPTSLAGASAPRLPLDAHGHLAKVRAVRDFFDFCLGAQSELTAAALDALVAREIAAQLDGTVAQAEALDVWTRYRAYLAALSKLPAGGAVLGDKLDLSAMALALDQRASLASRMLGAWSEPFFGAEQRRQRYDLERLRIARDPSLTPAQKAARLDALAQQLPSDERAALARETRQRDALEQISRLRQSGASPDEVRAQIAQTLGPQAAQRVAQMERSDADWHARYAAYAQERAQIDAAGLSPQEHDARIAQLRARYFTGPGEALRAASFDRARASAQTQ